MSDNMISFAAGMVYGFTSTVVGQPLDTVKTRMQARPSEMSKGTLKALTDLWGKEGFRGLYRGAAPLFVGGGLMRSAQFGCYDIAYRTITTREGRDPEAPPPRILGVFNPEVIAAGFCGGLGRAVVEAPADYIKTRRQVDRPWSLRDMTNSSVGITMLRNSFLFMSFSVYTDVSEGEAYVALWFSVADFASPPTYPVAALKADRPRWSATVFARCDMRKSRVAHSLACRCSQVTDAVSVFVLPPLQCRRRFSH